MSWCVDISIGSIYPFLSIFAASCFRILPTLFQFPECCRICKKFTNLGQHSHQHRWFESLDENTLLQENGIPSIPPHLSSLRYPPTLYSLVSNPTRVHTSPTRVRRVVNTGARLQPPQTQKPRIRKHIQSHYVRIHSIYRLPK